MKIIESGKIIEDKAILKINRNGNFDIIERDLTQKQIALQLIEPIEANFKSFEFKHYFNENLSTNLIKEWYLKLSDDNKTKGITAQQAKEALNNSVYCKITKLEEMAITGVFKKVLGLHKIRKSFYR